VRSGLVACAFLAGCAIDVYNTLIKPHLYAFVNGLCYNRL
jgi:hypothetical protein